jgi:hypothetical protein
MKVTFRGKPLIPSKYLEAADLQGKRVPVVIDSVHEQAKLKSDRGDDETKPLFRLRGKDKGWVLNSTNLDSIAEVYGHEADKWIGKVVVIYAAKVKAFGEYWQAIRVDVDATRARADAAKKAPPQQQKQATQAEPPHDEETGEVDSDEYEREQQERAASEMTEESGPTT